MTKTEKQQIQSIMFQLQNLSTTSERDNTLHDSMLADTSITESAAAANLLRENLQNLDHEEFWILILNSSNQPLRKVQICVGNLTSTVIDMRKAVLETLEAKGRGVIAYHNHPSSGNPQPSKEDITITEQLKAGLGLFDISLLDHIIITNRSFYSFADEEEHKY